MNWSQTHYNIETKVGQKYPITYFYKGDKKIIDVSPSCGCTGAELSRDKLEIVFTAQPAPLAVSNYPYVTDKSVLITYDDYSTDKLTFTAKIHG